MARPLPEATVFRSEVRQFTSTCTNQTYRLSIWLPPSYSDQVHSYPTLFLLDSDLLFGAAANLALPLMWGEELPEFIIVGVGYENLRSYDEWAERRRHHFKQEPALFLSFLASELIPFVDHHYRTDPSERAITGHSLGGYFVWYTLFHQPALFRRYCAGSPGVDEQVLAFEQQFAATVLALPVTVVVVVGGLETDQVSDLQQFCTNLQGTPQRDMDVRLLVLEGESHGTVIARLMTMGWKTMYA